MEESTVAAASVEAIVKERNSVTEDDNSNSYIENGSVTLMDGTGDHRSTISLVEDQTKDEEDSGGTDIKGKELNRDSSGDMEESQADVASIANEQVTSLHAPVDQAAQDLQAQEDELRELGINVVDQLSLERNVEAAVSRDHCSVLSHVHT